MKIEPRIWLARPTGSSTGTRASVLPTRRVLATTMALLISIAVATPDLIFAAAPESTASPIVEPTPEATEPSAEPTPSPLPTPTPTPVPVARSPRSLNLYQSAGFRYQNPSYIACTATSVMDMLNFVSLGHQGGLGFVWSRSLSTTKRDAILVWARAHDTMIGGRGTDVHGWRNALNYFGWGRSALGTGLRVYEDVAYTSYSKAMNAAVRAMISTHKPVALVVWGGSHAAMITGYDGLSGDPFARDRHGRYADTFHVDGFYLSDPLRESARRNIRVSNTQLQHSVNAKLRFQRYFQTDSPYDDPYTSGRRISRLEWYNKWVLILPVR